MIWSDLSITARSVLEWLVDPYTERKHTLVITVGERVRVDGKLLPCLPHPVDETVFRECVTFVLADEEEPYTTREVSGETLTVRVS